MNYGLKGIIITSIIILVMICLIGFAFLSELIGLHWMHYFGVKESNIEREMFEETKSYNEGKIQDLIKYKYEYDLADEKEKQIIANTIRHMFADYDEEKIKSEELKTFLKKIKYGGMK